MKKKLRKLLSEKGLSLIDVMIAMAITAVVSYSLLTSVYQGGRLSSGNNTRTSLQAARQNLQKILGRYDNLQLTIANNTSFDCLFAPSTSCTGMPAAGYPFNLYDRKNGSARLLYNSVSGTQGMFSDGAFKHLDSTGDDVVDCVNSGDPSAPSYKCPIRVDLTWKPICANPTCNPALIQILGKFRVFRKDAGSSTSTTGTSVTIADSYNISMITSAFSDCQTPWRTILTSGSSLTAYRYETSNCAAPNVESRVCSRGLLSGSFTYKRCGCLAPWGTLVNVGSSISVWNYSTPPTSTLCASVSQTCQSSGSFTPASTYTNESCTNLGCSIWGTTVAHGASVTAYSGPNHASDCNLIAQSRTCTAGVLSGTYTNQSCALSGLCPLPWGGSIAVGASVTAYLNQRQSPTCSSSQTRTCLAGPALSGSHTFSSCTPCAGYLDTSNNSCWYFGTFNQSCTDVCATHGGVVNNYINDAGSSGKVTKCKQLLSATGAPGSAFNKDDDCTTEGVGYGCHYNSGVSNSQIICKSPVTTAAAKKSLVRRLCSCAL